MISFSADHHFHIGQAHLNQGKPCQDFALSGVLDNAVFAVVADGCSSGGQTDVGARILVLAAAQAIRQQRVRNRSVGDLVVPVAASQNLTLFSVRDALGLTQGDLLATSAVAYLSPEGGFVHLQGDGVVARKYRDGRLVASRYEWAENTPYYPAYALDERVFIQTHGGNLDAECATHQQAYFVPNEGFTLSPANGLTLRDGLRGFTTHFDAASVEELEYIAVFTDGVTQFKNREWTDVVHDLLTIPTSKGEFMKRRLGHLIRIAQKSGEVPMDDVGVAVIRIEQIPETEEAT